MEYLGEKHWHYFKEKSNSINNWEYSKEGSCSIPNNPKMEQNSLKPAKQAVI